MSATLSSRERVLRAIAHGDVDGTPCLFRAEPEVQARLRQALGLNEPSDASYTPLDLTRYFGGDTVDVRAHIELPDLTRVETVEDLERLGWPSRSTDAAGYAARAGQARATGLAVFGGVWASIFTSPRRQMGEAKFLMAMLEEPGFVARVVEKTTDCYLEINEAFFSRCATDLDVFSFGSDFGTQRSLFISAASFRRFFKPHLKRLTEHAKGYGLRVMFHTCGAVSDIISDLIQCGIDALDPVQVSAHNMSPKDLGKQFKGAIAFHGGISTQTTLPHCTPDQVRAEVRATIAALGPSGYVCGPDQEMIGDTPIENIAAMYEAIHGRCT